MWVINRVSVNPQLKQSVRAMHSCLCAPTAGVSASSGNDITAAVQLQVALTQSSLATCKVSPYSVKTRTK